LDAGTVELLTDPLQVLLVEDPPQGRDDPVAVLLRGRVRVDLDRREVLDAVDRGDFVADRLAEDIREVRRGVRGDEERPIPLPGEPDGRRAAHGALADAALPAEEDEPGRPGLWNHEWGEHSYLVRSVSWSTSSIPLTGGSSETASGAIKCVATRSERIFAGASPIRAPTVAAFSMSSRESPICVAFR